MKAIQLVVMFAIAGITPGSLLLAQSHFPGQHAGKFAVPDKVKPVVSAFDLQDVKLLNSRFRQNMEREEAWIMSIPVKRLLHSFRNNAGVYSALEGGYDAGLKLAGWEAVDCDLRGHSTGHILSGLALLYASTGESKYKQRGDSLVAGLAEVQKALNQDGYLSAYPQELINRNIAGKSVWAPWYTLHKILSGLIDQYLYCDNQEALEVAKGMGNWAFKKLKPLSSSQRTTMLRNEFGGINESFYNLYAITGNADYQWLGDFFYHNETLDPLKAGNDILENKHANTYIPKLLGLTRQYELDGGAANDSIAAFFWRTVVDHHSFATGSNSDKEKFFKPDNLSAHLSGYTGESCNVYNMLKLTRHLFTHTGDIKYADYYERALFNHILGQQDPTTGMVAYFLPMLPGAHKVYSTPDSSFWCCVGSGFENQAKYGESIYYHSDDELYVNLFIPSQLTWKEKSFSLTQQTTFPDEATMHFSIKAFKPTALTIKLRYPSWATNGAMLMVNGKKVKVNQQPGGYISVARTWGDGDKIDVTYPMSLRIVPANDNPSVVAIACGPIVLAGEMGTANFSDRQPYSDPSKHNDYYTYDYHVPASISNQLNLGADDLLKGIKKMNNDRLEFSMPGTDVKLKPLYDIHRERYIVYWKLK